jgi:hypothetical protein
MSVDRTCTRACYTGTSYAQLVPLQFSCLSPRPITCSDQLAEPVSTLNKPTCLCQSAQIYLSVTHVGSNLLATSSISVLTSTSNESTDFPEAGICFSRGVVDMMVRAKATCQEGVASEIVPQKSNLFEDFGLKRMDLIACLPSSISFSRLA